MKSLDFSFADFKTTFEINKDIFDVNCYMYFYVGDATGYYKQDGTRVPYKKYLVEISLDPQDDTQQFTGAFKINKQCPLNIRINATTKFYVQNNKYYLEFPDERFVKKFLGEDQVCLVYNKKEFFLRLNVSGDSSQWDSNNPFNIPDFQEQLKNSGIEEFKNCIVNFFSSNLPASEPSLNIKWQTDMRCPLHYDEDKWYSRSDCSYTAFCMGASLGRRVQTSWRAQYELGPSFDYNDSLGIFTRTYHGFFIEIIYSADNSFAQSGFEVLEYANFIDKFEENLERTKLIDLKLKIDTASKSCVGPCDSTNCPPPDPIQGGATFDGAGPDAYCNNESKTGEIDIGGGSLVCLNLNCNCTPTGITGEAGCICGSSMASKPRPCYYSTTINQRRPLTHAFAYCTDRNEICRSYDSCCCSEYSIFKDATYTIFIPVETQFIHYRWRYTVPTKIIQNRCVYQDIKTATTILKLEKKDNCYSSNASQLIRTIFRLTDNQTTPPIQGCDFVRNQYRVKIFEDSSNQFRSTYFVTPQQFQNGSYYHEVPPLSCIEHFDLNNQTREFFKIDPEISSKIPFYIDEFNNLKFIVVPDRLQRKTRYNPTCFSVQDTNGDGLFEGFSGNTNNNIILEKCSYDAIVIQDDNGNQVSPTITLNQFLFILTPVYNPGPPIDSYFIMTCFIQPISKLDSSGAIFSSNSAIVRSPQDLYQDLTFNVAPNITWTINLLGTWRG